MSLHRRNQAQIEGGTASRNSPETNKNKNNISHRKTVSYKNTSISKKESTLVFSREVMDPTFMKSIL